jgi:hypothetical protein
VLADEAVLSFTPLPDATIYRVQVEDEAGRYVFDAEVRSPPISVPPATFRPGARYVWFVRTVSGAGPVARGEAEFKALGQDLVAARRAFRASLGDAEDAETLGLLAEVDRALGLRLAARDGFAAAVTRDPGNAELRAAAARLDAALKESSGSE